MIFTNFIICCSDTVTDNFDLAKRVVVGHRKLEVTEVSLQQVIEVRRRSLKLVIRLLQVAARLIVVLYTEIYSSLFVFSNIKFKS